jgi:uncharacterized membrane protein
MAVPSSRLAYIDWLRGLACLLMFQTHCYDAWLGGSARLSTFFVWSQLGGTFPAPLFLFLAGTSFAIVIDKLLQKGVAPSEIAKKTIVRGAEIFVLGLLFRLQEYVIALGWAPWSDLFRVDILNTIGVSLMLMGAVCWMVLAITGTTNSRTKLVSAAVLVAAVISALTPLLWTTWQPRFLPWEIETYINGVHNFGVPQAGLFPVFPWTGFAFAGLAFGFLLMSDSVRKLGAGAFLLAAVAGLVLIYGAKFVDTLGWKIYPVYDFWTTSPSFFAIRLGMLLLLVLIAYAWCSWGLGQRGFSPMIQLGNTSLLVYWVHIELVYGKFRILPPRSQTIGGATRGLITIFLAMLALSIVRTKWLGSVRDLFARRKISHA